jgi:hypothetical protein
MIPLAAKSCQGVFFGEPQVDALLISLTIQELHISVWVADIFPYNKSTQFRRRLRSS